MAIPHRIVADSTSLMLQLSRMAGIPEGGFRRMVLVLDINAMPVLYTEGLIRAPVDESLELVPTLLIVEEKAVEVDLSNGLRIHDAIERYEPRPPKLYDR